MKAHSTESKASRDGIASAKKNIEAIYPLSPLQQGMLFHSVREPGSGVYVTQLECTIEGEVDYAAFERAWQEVINRHPALRTGFFWQRAGEPVQIVSRRVAFSVGVRDWRQVPGHEQPSQWKALVQEDRHRGFNLEAAPLMRGNLVKVADERHRFLWSCHHILLDGWSLPLVLREVFAFYEAFTLGRRLELESPRPYRDFIAWLRRQDPAEAEQYWREQLAGFDTPVKLPIDRFVGEAPKGYLAETLQLPTSCTCALRTFAQNYQLTLNTVIQAAWALLLSRLAGAKDIVFGVTVSGRPTELSGVEDVVGLFINTIPLRVKLDPSTRLVELLKELQARNAMLRQYDYMSLSALQRWADVPKGEPLFDSILVFENYPVEASLTTKRRDNLIITEVQVHEQTNYPLTLVVAPGDCLSIQITFDCQQFRPSTIKRLQSQMHKLLESMVANSGAPLSGLELLTPDERRQLLMEWNDTHAEYPRDLCLHQLFEAQVEKSPDATAVVFEDKSLTYVELNARANQVARYLRSLGVGPDTLVGLCVERSLDMVVALFGILKAGGAYVPLDSAYPEERLAFMLEDTQAPVLVTQSTQAKRLPASKAQLILLDRDWAAIAQQAESNPANRTLPEHCAYVIHTSGSTGKPKGIQIPHVGLVNFLCSMVRQPGIGADDIVPAVTTMSFDISTLELFLPLMVGACTVVVSREVAQDGNRLSALLADCGTTMMQATPPTWQLLISAGWQGKDSLKLLCGGEVLSVQLANQLRERAATVWNMYGPTEATVWASVSRVEAVGGNLPIGPPIANTQLYILDTEFNPVPVGVAGELYIGGVQLARGYLNRPDLTAERFVPSPYADTPGARLYKTGDLARFLPDGNIEFLGRIDHQVKLRGFRIELGEIEAVLTQHPAVREAVVLAREDHPGDKRLAAYVVAAADTGFDVSALRAALKGALPEYMVPAAFVVLEALPLTPNGKIDRKALPAPDLALALAHEYVAPRTPTEQTLAEIWAEVLSVEQVGIHDNFFELGGHSLLVTQVVSRIRAAFEVELPLRTLFEAPTVAELAHAVEAARHAGDGLQAPPIMPVPRDTDLPLSFAQQRLWFLDQLTPNDPFYNMPGVVRLQGALDVTALEGSLNALIARHEALRTTFCTADGEAVQVISAELKLALPLVDLTEVSAEARETKARALAAEEAQRPFDLATGPLVRAQLLCMAEDDHLLEVTFHHIVSDGWSLGVFIEELATLYRAQVSGQPMPLTPLPIQYADFAHWQRQWLQGEVLDQQLAYWREQLQGLPPLLELPTDRPRPAMQTFHGAHHSITISPALTQALRTLSREAGVTLFMTLLAAFQVLLARYTGQHDFAVGTPIANRNRAETEGLIGFFVNTLALRARFSDNPSFQDLLARTKESTLGAYAHQDLPLERLVDELQPERDLSHAPLFQVMFALQNTPVHALELPDLKLTPWTLESGTAKFDLSLELAEEGDALTGTFEYNIDLFEAVTIERLADHLVILLEGVTKTPAAKIAELPLLTAAEGQQLLVEWNATQTDYPKDQCIHQLFEQQVERTPAATAVVFEDQSLTYAALNAKANQLAHYLRSLGVGPDILVGLCVERSLEMIIGLLGILKAGGAYVPLDPNYPQERLAFMLEDTQTPVVVTQDTLVVELPLTNEREVVILDRDWSTVTSYDENNPVNQTLPEHLGYVIYTSGSTGRPKGVTTTHRNITNSTGARIEYYGGVENWLFFTSLAFDSTSAGLLWTLSTGGQVTVAPEAAATDFDLLNELMRTKRPSHFIAVSSLYNAIIETGFADNLGCFKRVIVGGEALTSTIVERHKTWSPQASLHNEYGPTEATVWTTVRSCYSAPYNGCDPDIEVADDTVSIGRPIANTQAYILDSDLNPAPVGVRGELYIGGVQLARGYLNRADLTAERFIPHPFSETSGERLYRTGDLARYLSDGDIELLGRLDHQVKIRGFRIELGEIEVALTQHPEVREAVVLARERSSGEKRLVAYVVALPEANLNITALRAYLNEKLPEYMVPSAFVFLDAVPLNPNGKIDRESLPAADPRSTLGEVYRAPRNATELTLADIWANVLGVNRVGIKDNFFQLGGHSLLAVKLMAAVEKRFGRVLPLASLFHAPTIEKFAANLEARQDRKRWSPLVPLRVEGSEKPFFCVPGADGSVLSLQRLAYHLGPDQPFYGLEAVGLDGASAPLERIEDMAVLYISAIKSVQPDGPYLLGGYSLGGWVAFEMALRLRKRGEEVEQLIIIDVAAPHTTRSSQRLLNDRDFFNVTVGVLERQWGVDLQLTSQELAGLSSKEQAEYLHQALHDAGVLPADFGKAELDALMRVMKTNSRIRYTPAENLPQRLSLLRTSETGPRDVRGVHAQRVQEDDPTLGWCDSCDGPVEVDLVPGEHSTLVAEPHVRALAEKLKALLATGTTDRAA